MMLFLSIFLNNLKFFLLKLKYYGLLLISIFFFLTPNIIQASFNEEESSHQYQTQSLKEEKWSYIKDSALKGFVEGYGEGLVTHTEIACHNLVLKTGRKIGNYVGDIVSEPLSYLIAFTLNNTVSYPYIPDNYGYYLQCALSLNGIFKKSIDELINFCIEDPYWKETSQKLGKLAVSIARETLDIILKQKINLTGLPEKAASGLIKGATEGFYPEYVSIFEDILKVLDQPRQNFNALSSNITFNFFYNETRGFTKSCCGCYGTRVGTWAAENYACPQICILSNKAKQKLSEKISDNFQISSDDIKTRAMGLLVKLMFKQQGERLARWTALNLFEDLAKAVKMEPQSFIEDKQKISFFDKFIVITPYIPLFLIKESCKKINTAYKKGRQFLYAETDEKDK